MKPEDTGNGSTVPVTPPTPPADPVVPSTPEVPATPPVTPPESPTVPTPPVTPEAPGMSEEQVASIRKDITESVSGEVSKSVIQKIGDALGLSKKEEEELPKSVAEIKKLVDTEVADRFDKSFEVKLWRIIKQEGHLCSDLSISPTSVFHVIYWI